MIYLYAITGPLTQQIDGRGLEGAALQAAEMGALTAIYSTHQQLPLRADADACWAHEEAVEAVMSVQTVLPARFGTTFIDLDALRAAVRGDASSLEERLEQIDGCVELAVRIDPLGAEDGQTASGQQYLGTSFPPSAGMKRWRRAPWPACGNWRWPQRWPRLRHRGARSASATW